MDPILIPINTYIYPEYVLAVILFTALVRYMFYGIDNVVHPKWITLIVGLILGVAGYAIKTLQGEQYELFKVLISFGLSTLGYDYFWKVVKDLIKQKP